MIRRPPRSTQSRSSAASDVYKRQRLRLVFPDPLRQPHHRQALAGALGVPDDAALARLDAMLGGFDAEVLVVAGGLLHARVEHDEVVDELEEAVLRAHLQ